MRDDTVTALKNLLIDHLYVDIPEDQIGVDDGLRTIVGLDSVGFVELRLLCERRFNVLISDEDYTPAHFGSLRPLAELIERLQSAPPKPAV